MSYQHANIKYIEQGIVELSIINAKSLNILSTPVIQDLTQAINELKLDETIRCLVLRGDGDKAFIAGADIKEMGALNKEKAHTFIDNLRKLCDAVRFFPVPVIARIPGWCLGGGLELAAACDLRIASEEAQLGMPEVKVGIPSIIHAALLPKLIGYANTNWLLLTAEIIDANEAKSWGLLNKVVKPNTLDETILKTAKTIAECGPNAIKQQKRLIREWQQENLEDSILNGVTEFANAFDTGEPTEYLNAFFKDKK